MNKKLLYFVCGLAIVAIFALVVGFVLSKPKMVKIYLISSSSVKQDIIEVKKVLN